MNYQKVLYFVLVGVSLMFCAYFGASSLRTMIYNYLLNRPVSARVIQWEVEEIGFDRYAVRAHYTYDVDGRNYPGQALFVKPLYPNPDIAIASLKEMALQNASYPAWVRATDPTISALEKPFPFSSVLRMVVSGVLVAYFLFKKKVFLNKSPAQ